MIGKLIILGIAVAAIVLVVPGLLKGSQHSAALDTIKQGITYANHTIGNATGSVGYGGLLEISGNGKTGGTMSGGVQGAGQAQDATSLPPQDVVKQTYTGQVFEKDNGTCQVSVPGMDTSVNGQRELAHIISVPDCNLTVNQPVQVTTITPKQNATQSPDAGTSIEVVPYVESNNDGSSSPQAGTGSPAGNPSEPQAPPYFQTVQLNAVNQGSSAMLSYDDTTGQTIQVTVTMRNSEKVLFTGTFYSSKFHTQVNDVPNTPHTIEMTIQNAIYGTLHASVYAPSNMQNSTISGIFTS